MGHEQLNREKRQIIERLLEQNHSIRQVASILGYSPSAISQEIRRNSMYVDGKRAYRSIDAQRKAKYREKRYRTLTCKPQALVSYVINKLKEYWSPEQIHGRLEVDYPDDPTMRISFKTIYRWVERSKQSGSPLGIKTKYTRYLRLKRQRKYVKGGKPKNTQHRKLPSISKRPKEAEKKVEFGHWEGDLVLGFGGKENAVTLVDISTGLLLAVPCKNKKKEVVALAIQQAFQQVPRELVKTITFDRGSEFYSYRDVEKGLECRVYFCHPQAPNERALNEQTNGLLRQFYPKRKRTVFTDSARLKWAVDLINNRPRKKFRYRTTWEIIEERGLAQALSLV